ncbi:hypothetical protein KBTX_03388 [wastewater metagenome]|uniref:Uncharacterized protein n=2 Tax=unclassified sequences TaxID=12908 RepID=A0A5B8RHS4_9ZZZZ|nr:MULTISPECIES: hypothetical protein [Arhodomonas]MCS4504445.1 hypothetical protein [Arhodomonas aquaeolei]QEA07044.1 hypothetical protein KBTEX_03388 [uncultured organism]
MKSRYAIALTLAAVTTVTMMSGVALAGESMGCADDLKMLNKRLDVMPEGMHRNAVQSHYDAAQKAMEANDEKTCRDEVAKARQSLMRETGEGSHKGGGSGMDDES